MDLVNYKINAILRKITKTCDQFKKQGIFYDDLVIKISPQLFTTLKKTNKIHVYNNKKYKINGTDVEIVNNLPEDIEFVVAIKE